MNARIVGPLAALMLVAACGSDLSDVGPRSPGAIAGLAVASGGAVVPPAPGSAGAGRRECRPVAPGTGCARGGAPAAPAWAEGRLIVKFKDGLREPADVVQAYGRRFASDCRTGGQGIDALNARYGVRRVEPVFRSLFGDSPSAPGRGALAERRRSVESSLARSRAAFPERSRRAPSAAAVPDLANVYYFRVPPGTDILRMARDYAANENVAYAVPDHAVRVDAVPNDPYFVTAGSWGQPHFDLWGLRKIGAPAAWDSTTGLGAVVAVVDTGLDYGHPDIAANVWTNAVEEGGLPGVDDDGNGFVDDLRGWSFASDSADVMDRQGHGTHVAGTVAAVGNNALGVVGVAHAARVMAVKGLGDYGTGYNGDLASAIVYAANNGADVISNSWGCFGGAYCGSPIVTEALAIARSMGCVVTFAAGNDAGDVKLEFPVNAADVITVASTAPDDSRSSFSNFGHAVDVAAPGSGYATDPGGILSLRAAGTGSASYVVGDSYIRKNGTSMATPHVSGVAALLLAANPALTVAEVEAIIKRTAADQVGEPALDLPGHDVYFGWGRIDAAAAVARAFDPPADPPLRRLLADPPLEFVLPQSSCGGSWSLPLEIYNLGGGTLDWSTSGPSWLTVTPPSGANTTASIAATVSAIADRTGTLSLTSLGGEPVAIPVSEQIVPGVRVVGCDAALARAPGPQMWGAYYQNFNDSPPGVADGAGGAIYVWTDWRNWAQLYAQRVDGLGSPLWAVDGIPLTDVAVVSMAPGIVSDGAGGAIVVWTEGPSPSAEDRHIRVQRVDASGQKLWGEGIWISQGIDEDRPVLVPDGAGGAVVAWEARVSLDGYESDLYAQRVDSTGAAQWTAGGVAVTLAAGSDWNVEVAPDGAGGAYLAWDGQGGSFAQHVGATGGALWGSEPIMLASASVGATVVPDGSGGAIVAWRDFWDWTFNDIHATRFDAAGALLWGTSVPVVQGQTAAGTEFYPTLQNFKVAMAGDGDGGAVIVWMDHREDGWDIYAQKLAADGSRRWGQNGAPVTRAGQPQISPQVLPDGNEGAIVAWTDFRSGEGDVFVQRLDATGSPLLGTNGLWLESKSGGLSGPFSNDLMEGDQGLPYLVSLGNHRVFVTWEDYTLERDTDFVGKVIEFASDLAIAPAGASVAPGGTVAFSASGGSGSGRKWSIPTNGSGGTIDPATGAYSAGPIGNVTDAVQVKDSFGNVASVEVAVVAAIAIAPASAAVAPREALAFSASGGSGTGWEWSLATNASGGTIDPGTGAYAAGSTGGVTDVVQVRDSWGTTASREVTVTAGVSLTPPGATVAPRQTLAFEAVGGSGGGYAWSLASTGSGGEVDAGTGVYRAGADGGVVDVVQVTDSLGNGASASITVTAGLSVTPSSSTLAPGAGLWLSAEGGSGEGYAWTFVSNGSGGSIVSYGAAVGAYEAGRVGDAVDVVEVTDSLGNSARVEIAVTAGLSIAPSSPTVAPLSALEFEATGGSGEGFLWLFSSAESGGSIDPATGAYRAGTQGDSVDVVHVLDSLGNEASASVTVTAGLAVSPGSASLRTAESQPFAASGGSGTGYAWTLRSSPSGGTVDAATGLYVAGSVGGVADVIQVTDSLGNVGTATAVVSARPPDEPSGGCGCGGGGAGGASILLAALFLALAPRPRRSV